MLEQWSPWFSWFMDLTKFAITFITTALVSVFIIEKHQEKRTKLRNRSEALFQLQLDALREFRRAAVTYEVAALTAYTDVYQWKGGDKTSAMQQYENMAFGGMNAALDGLESRFKDSRETTTDIQKLRDTHKTRHVIYDELVDSQLDSGHSLHLWNEADSGRKEFDALLGETKQLRKDIITTVETEILEPKTVGSAS